MPAGYPDVGGGPQPYPLPPWGPPSGPIYGGYGPGPAYGFPTQHELPIPGSVRPRIPARSTPGRGSAADQLAIAASFGGSARAVREAELLTRAAGIVREQEGVALLRELLKGRVGKRRKKLKTRGPLIDFEAASREARLNELLSAPAERRPKFRAPPKPVSGPAPVRSPRNFPKPAYQSAADAVSTAAKFLRQNPLATRLVGFGALAIDLALTGAAVADWFSERSGAIALGRTQFRGYEARRRGGRHRAASSAPGRTVSPTGAPAPAPRGARAPQPLPWMDTSAVPTSPQAATTIQPGELSQPQPKPKARTTRKPPKLQFRLSPSGQPQTLTPRFAQPRVSSQPKPATNPLARPQPAAKTRPAPALQTQPAPAPLTSPKTDARECECKPSKRKQERKRKAPRRVCYKGSYLERAKGLIKHRREQIPCL